MSQIYDLLLKQNKSIKKSLQELQKYVERGTLTKEEAVMLATIEPLKAEVDARIDIMKEEMTRKSDVCPKCGDEVLNESGMCGRCV